VGDLMSLFDFHSNRFNLSSLFQLQVQRKVLLDNPPLAVVPAHAGRG
jgi:hypothetical protein